MVTLRLLRQPQLNVSLKVWIETTPVECIIESLDGKSQLKITAFTTERVIGDIKAIDWSMCAREWPRVWSFTS